MEVMSVQPEKTELDEDVEKNANNAEETENTQETDPYAYLEREDFTSERHKIEIKNLPRFYGIGEFRKLLGEKLKLDPCKIKTPRRNSPYAFVCFRSDADRDAAIKTLTNYKWKGKLLNAIKAKPAPDPLVKKRKEIAEDDSESKKLKVEGQSQEERLKFSTTPLWNVPYDEQLVIKQNSIKKVLTKLGNELAHHNPSLRKWIDSQKESFDGLPCKLLDIRYADQQDEYRNKCEFTVGIDEETGLPTVGFRIGSYVKGIIGVGPVHSMKHIPQSMKNIVNVFQQFVRTSSLEVFNPELHTGHFKQVTVRTSSQEMMLIVGMHPQNLSPEDLKVFKKNLIDFFSEGLGKDINVTSLYYQEIVKRESGKGASSPEHLMGKTHITEKVMDLDFKISPEAFFQVNTAAAEVLYKSAIELAAPTMDTTIVDICCGTGTIGLCFAKSCGQVLGLEVIAQAIEDAKENAVNNGVDNCEFFVGKAEDILTSVVYKAAKDEVVAVVDPPRAGLHQRAILQLRRMKKISKIIYVSCNPEAAFKNFVDFGRPESKTVHGEPFLPVKAVTIDMFPHTKHCELVILFERKSTVPSV